MRYNKIILFAGVIATHLFAASCVKIAENDLDGAGEIRFSASTSAAEAGIPTTKTAYGAVSGSTKILTWSANDRISIYAPNEFNYYDGQATIPAISYAIGDQSLTGTTSTAASVTAVTANTALQWGSATGAASHHFYGKYPDPAWDTGSGTPYGDSEPYRSQETKSVYFNCYLPAMQPFERTGYVCAPSMKYLYMTAYAATERNATVALNFKPAVSTFHITFKNQYVGEDFIVKSVELVSASKWLSGNYSVDIAASASTPTLYSETGTASDKRVGVDFGSGLTIPKNNTLDVTLFTRPVALDDLSIVITTTDGDVQKLELKDNLDTYLSFPAGKYFDITCGDVPDPFTYDIEISGGDVVAATGDNPGTVANPYTLEIDCQGTTTSSTFSLVSVKDKLSLISATPWKVEYSANGSSWSTTSPVPGFSVTAPSYDGSTSGETVTVTMPGGSSSNMGTTTIDTFNFSSTNGGTASDIPLDLSYYDGVADTVYDTDLSTNQETANCYIIRGAGWYSYPLVYGNGIKNGAANTNAYHLASVGSGQLQNFVKGDNTAIYSAGTIADVQISGAYSAEILWQDCTDNIITNLSVSGGNKVVFQVQNPKPCNAVIQVKNSGGSVLWSWHIWLVADEQDLTEVEVTNHQGRTFGMLTSNLGQLPVTSVNANGYPRQDVFVRFTTTSDPTKAQSVVLKVTRPIHITSSTPNGKIVSPMYQWGRKDPMLTGGIGGSERTKNGDIPGYSYKGSLSSTPNVSYGNATYIYVTIGSPGTFFTKTNGVNHSWLYGTLYYNLWDTTQTSTVPSSDYGTSIKSVYDPCPRGYKVARKYDFTGFTSTGDNTATKTELNVIGDYSNGWTFKKNSSDTEGIFFPESGMRYDTSGLQNYGSAYIWTSSSYGASNGEIIAYSQNGLAVIEGISRATGCAVRAVKDN